MIRAKVLSLYFFIYLFTYFITYSNCLSFLNSINKVFFLAPNVTVLHQARTARQIKMPLITEVNSISLKLIMILLTCYTCQFITSFPWIEIDFEIEKPILKKSYHQKAKILFLKKIFCNIRSKIKRKIRRPVLTSCITSLLVPRPQLSARPLRFG